jgi:DNA modification methylase
MMELNKIYCGDNCDLLGQLPRDCVDLVVTSPPYDDLRTYGGHTWDFYGVAWQLKRVLKPGGVIVWVVADKTTDGDESGSSMRQALHFKSLGLKLWDTMIWNKYLPGDYGKRYVFAWEYMFILCKDSPKTWNPITRPNIYTSGGTSEVKRGMGGKGKMPVRHAEGIEENVWRIQVGGGKTCTDGTKHPAMFPEELARKHILSWSNPRDIVLDPFMGGGTTAKIAKSLERNFLGFEINPEYCKIAERRIAQGVLDFAS